jgi:hypothetical protein
MKARIKNKSKHKFCMHAIIIINHYTSFPFPFPRPTPPTKYHTKTKPKPNTQYNTDTQPKAKAKLKTKMTFHPLTPSIPIPHPTSIRAIKIK